MRIDDLYATVVTCTVFAGVPCAVFELIDRTVVFRRPRDDR